MNLPFYSRHALATLGLLVALSQAGAAEDWPTFRRDIARSGVTSENLTLPLTQQWLHTARFKPVAAFGPGYPKHTNWEGGVEKRRIDFDRSDSVVVAGGSAYFGSGGDGKVYCVDAATGKPRWTFFTGGPVRLAPTVFDGRVYFGSDDGHVYCLKADDGSVVWKFRAAPDDLRVVGNGHLISLWPVRTGVLIDAGVAYFGAGIFPTEGVFLFAVDAASGKLIWKNDQASELRMAQISPQGYLLATGDRLIVPMSRLAPAVYERKNGRMETKLSIYFGGGTFATLQGECLYTGCEGAQCFPLQSKVPAAGGTSHTLASFPGGQLVASAGRLYSCGTPKGEGVSAAVVAYEWNQPQVAPNEQDSHRGTVPAPSPPKELWSCPFPSAECMVLAGGTLFVGGPGQLAAVDTKEGKIRWTAKVDGTALNLAVAGGRLYASTDSGCIYCFGSQPAAVANAVTTPATTVAPQWKQAVDLILARAPQVNKGYALVYGVETGELAIELANRTELQIRAVTADPAKAAAARQRIDAAGLYGGRIVVEEWPLDHVPYTPYFADLVVSETAIATGKPPGTAAEVFRMTKPIRGTAIIGRTTVEAADADAINKWLADSPWKGTNVSRDGGTWVVAVRPPLAGARPWTHQYAGPGGTASSEDDEVRGPLRVQWFGDPGPSEFVDRHYWGAATLAYEGRMFCCSYNDVTAYDVYTGNKLWTFPLKNATRAHLADVPGNVAIGPEGYFVAVEEICYRLDPATGKLLGQYKLPDAPGGQRRMWGYVACVDGMLVGSRTLGFLPMQEWRKSRGEKVLRWLLSDSVFAMEAKTGKLVWDKQVGPFRHNTIVASAAEGPRGATLFYSHDGGTDAEKQAALAETRPLIEAFPDKEKQAALKALAKPHVEQVTALDLKTGQPRWERVVDWSVCGGDRGTLIHKDGLLLMLSDVGGCKAFSGYGLEEHLGESITVRNAQTGKIVWLKALNHRSRAVVVANKIYAEPWAFDLRTGDRQMMKHPVTGQDVPWMFMRAEKHCGPFNASAHTLFFRNGGFGYCDVPSNEGVARFESNRPNCWLSFISAEGLALWPSADSGCRCDLAISCSVALVHDERSRTFGDFAATGPMTPVRSLAINFGGAGDRRDKKGTLWLGYPRAKFTSAIELPVKEEVAPGGGMTVHSSTWTKVDNTPSPWLYTSAAMGLKRFELKLRKPEDGPGKYKLSLHFSAPGADKPGSRVFDVRVQGRVVRDGLDVVKEAGAADKALVVSFDAIDVKEDLVLELVPRTATLPLVCAMNVELAGK